MDESHNSVENKPCILSLTFKFPSIHPFPPNIPALEFSREKYIFILHMVTYTLILLHISRRFLTKKKEKDLPFEMLISFSIHFLKYSNETNENRENEFPVFIRYKWKTDGFDLPGIY